MRCKVRSSQTSYVLPTYFISSINSLLPFHFFLRHCKHLLKTTPIFPFLFFFCRCAYKIRKNENQNTILHQFRKTLHQLHSLLVCIVPMESCTTLPQPFCSSSYLLLLQQERRLVSRLLCSGFETRELGHQSLLVPSE